MTLTDWINEQNFQFKRNNIRPWGTYDLLVSADGGVSWVGMPRAFGSRIDEIVAFEMVLTENKTDDRFKSELIHWIGQDRATELLKIIEINCNKSVTLSE
jgi:hypothetical protein